MSGARPDPPFGGYEDLSRAFRRGRDYEIVVERRPGARLAVIAPHGGRIENGTSEVARALAGEEFHLYLFEGTLEVHNYRSLHLTSHLFDEPQCLELLAGTELVLAVHGCGGDGELAYLGGRDEALRDRLAAALRDAGIAAATDGHPFPAQHPLNVCNRGAGGRGAQLELTHALRDGPASGRVADALRPVLLALGRG